MPTYNERCQFSLSNSTSESGVPVLLCSSIVSPSS